MKTFTIKKDKIIPGIEVFLGDMNDYYIRLSNTSYPVSVRRYLNRKHLPIIKNNNIYDVDYFTDKDAHHAFLCKPAKENTRSVIIMVKHKVMVNGQSKLVKIIYGGSVFLYSLVELSLGGSFTYTVSNENERDLKFFVSFENGGLVLYEMTK